MNSIKNTTDNKIIQLKKLIEVKLNDTQNEKSLSVNILSFLVKECYNCDEILIDNNKCFYLHNITSSCKNNELCHKCKKLEKFNCVGCDETLCPKCIENVSKCEECNKPICEDCVYSCENCEFICCEYCDDIVRCHNCEKLSCKDCFSYDEYFINCDDCKNDFCRECTDFYQIILEGVAYYRCETCIKLCRLGKL